MEIRIKQEELEHLAQLVFLGNFVINGIRMPEDRIKAYDDIAERIYCKQYNAMLKIAECEAEENEIADIRDWLYDSVSQYLSAFEGEVFLEKLGGEDSGYQLSSGQTRFRGTDAEFVCGGTLYKDTERKRSFLCAYGSP